MKKFDSPLLSRREATNGILVTIGGAVLYACGGSKAASTPDAARTTTGAATEWASGGTKSMTAAASYPDPFAVPTAACVLATAGGGGPCTEELDKVRKDISEGYTGLPLRLALKIVDAACKPIAGAKVKIWHTSTNGSYSGTTPDEDCVKQAADIAKHYFRGVQMTDADGRVSFDTCFPGWYHGRPVHIHFIVSLNGKSFTMQLFFEEGLVAEIFRSHVEYKAYGQPDTPNAKDRIVGERAIAEYTLTTARMTDGAMLASKVLVVSV